MKRNLLTCLVALLATTLTATAQIEKGTVLLGGNIEFAKNTYKQQHNRLLP